MALNADKPTRWKGDIAASVDQFNSWFLQFAPLEYRQTRGKTVALVRKAMNVTDNFADLSPTTLRAHPGILATLRAATAPPLARDRLIGLAGVPPGLVTAMEAGRLPRQVGDGALGRLTATLERVLDRDLFPWLEVDDAGDEVARERAATVVADRLCGAMSDPIIRNAHEKRQVAVAQTFLEARGYRLQALAGQPIREMEPGTFTFRLNVPVAREDESLVNMPIDIVIQPKNALVPVMPLLIEAKSAGDFANTNKRRKEEATKIAQLRRTYGEDVQLILFLCGYFDAGYLGYSAHEGLDFVWEHRIEDLVELGV